MPISSCRALCASLLALIPLAGCVSLEDYEARVDEVRDQNQVIEDLQAMLDDYEDRIHLLESRDSDRRLDMESIEAERASLRMLQEKLRARFESLADDGLSGESSGDDQRSGYVILSGGVGVRVTGDLLFALGSYELSDRGREVLRQVANEANLGGNPDRRLRVVGHTDNTRIAKPETRQRFPLGNLQLSAWRALVVADFLIREGGLPADRISVEGFGDTRPLVPNDTTENKAKNRRCEIYFVDP